MPEFIPDSSMDDAYERESIGDEAPDPDDPRIVHDPDFEFPDIRDVMDEVLAAERKLKAETTLFEQYPFDFSDIFHHVSTYLDDKRLTEHGAARDYVVRLPARKYCDCYDEFMIKKAEDPYRLLRGRGSYQLQGPSLPSFFRRKPLRYLFMASPTVVYQDHLFMWTLLTEDRTVRTVGPYTALYHGLEEIGGIPRLLFTYPWTIGDWSSFPLVPEAKTISDDVFYEQTGYKGYGACSTCGVEEIVTPLEDGIALCSYCQDRIEPIDDRTSIRWRLRYLATADPRQVARMWVDHHVSQIV